MTPGATLRLAPPRGAAVTVLLVDDEPGMRQVVRRFIQQAFTVDVLEAEDGLGALDRLLTDRVDLVLLDLSMRVMDGIETLETIRRSKTFGSVPVVLLTGYADEERVRRAMELGIAGVMVKPLTPESLRERLGPILDGQPRGHRGSDCSPLELAPSQRVLVVDRSAEFRAVAMSQFHRVADVEGAENEFGALARCVSAPIDTLVIGTTSELSSFEGFARRVRGRPEFGHMRLVAAVAPGSVTETKALGLYDAVIIRSFVPETFEEGLRAVLGQSTLARFLLHHTSPCVADVFD